MEEIERNEKSCRCRVSEFAAMRLQIAFYCRNAQWYAHILRPTSVYFCLWQIIDSKHQLPQIIIVKSSELLHQMVAMFLSRFKQTIRQKSADSPKENGFAQQVSLFVTTEQRQRQACSMPIHHSRTDILQRMTIQRFFILKMQQQLFHHSQTSQRQ